MKQVKRIRRDGRVSMHGPLHGRPSPSRKVGNQMTESRPIGKVARRFAAIALCAIVVTPVAAPAQSRDYLLGSPYGSVTFRGGFAFARAGSDIFEEMTRDLTLDDGDFNAPAGALDLAIRVAPRFDIVLGAGYVRSSESSEYRDFVGTDDLPISQETEFTRVPLTGSLKFYLTEPGRRVGSLAWIPASFSPYVGAGGGATWYQFAQQGEFVNFETLDIFFVNIESDGWAWTWHAFGGIEKSILPRLALIGEARYSFGSTGLDPLAYDGYEDIDLSGLQASVGLQVRF
jgi:hypothetical protein